MYLLVCCVIMHHRKFCFGASICHLGSNAMFYASTCYVCDSFGLCCICCLETFSIGLCGLVCVVNGLLYADDLLRNKSFIRPHTSSYRSIFSFFSVSFRKVHEEGVLTCHSLSLRLSACMQVRVWTHAWWNCTYYRSFDLHLQCHRVWPWSMSHNRTR